MPLNSANIEANLQLSRLIQQSYPKFELFINL